MAVRTASDTQGRNKMSTNFRVNLYFPNEHPLSQVDKDKRATYIKYIIDEWYARDQRLIAIEDTLNQIKEMLHNGASVQDSTITKDEAFEAGMNELMMDILNMGKKGNFNDNAG